MIRIILALQCLTALAAIAAWWSSPVRPLAWLVALLAMGGTLALARDRRWLASLPPRRRMLGAVLWQLPGLASASASAALILGWRGPQVLIVLLQLWTLPLAPLAACLPHARLHGAPLALWAEIACPWLTTALVLLAARWRVQPATSSATASARAPAPRPVPAHASQQNRPPPGG